MAEPSVTLRKWASLPRKQLYQRRRMQRTRAEIPLRPLTARSGSTGKSTGSHRSRKCGCRSAGETPREWRLPAQWSDRDTAAGIHGIGFDNRAGGADSHAGHATAASSVTGLSMGSGNINEQFAEEKNDPASRLRISECLPVQPSPAFPPKGAPEWAQNRQTV